MPTNRCVAFPIFAACLLFCSSQAAAHSDFSPLAPALLRVFPEADSLQSPDMAALAAGGSGTWIAAWHETAPAATQVRCSRSLNDGTSWSPVPCLTTNPQSAPALATDGAGNWLLANLQTDDTISISGSSDNGATWSVPAPLATGMVSGRITERGVPIVASGPGGTWIVVWRESFRYLNEGMRIVFSRSSTGLGGPWSAPAPLHPETDAAFELGETPPPNLVNAPIRIVTDSLGTWLVAFDSGTPLIITVLGGVPRAEAHSYVRSTDDGQTWSAPAYFLANPVDEDWVRPTALVPSWFDLKHAPGGDFVAGWSELSYPLTTVARAMAIRSADGASWTDPVEVFNSATPATLKSWHLGHMATAGSDDLVVVGEGLDTSHDDISAGYFSDASAVWRSSDSGATWGPAGFVDPDHELPLAAVSDSIAAASNASGDVGILWTRHERDAADPWHGNSLWFSINRGACGNGIDSIGESCDDGNRDAGDGCSPSCDVEDCWQCSGSPTSVCTPLPNGTACTDADPCTVSQTCTAGTCGGGGVLADGTSCDDGVFCNGSETCMSGRCTSDGTLLCGTCTVCSEMFGQCIPGTDLGCHRPLPGLDLKLGLIGNLELPLKRRFKFQWIGSATDVSDFGNPTTSTSFELCMGPRLPSSSRMESDCSVLAAASDCGGKPCWREINGGFSYSDPRYFSEGSFIRKIKMKEGADGEAKIKIVGGGANLGLTDMSALPRPYFVWLRSSIGTSWQVAFPEADLQKVSTKVFKMKGGL